MDEPVYPDAERTEWPPITKVRKIISVPIADIPAVINLDDEEDLNPLDPGQAHHDEGIHHPIKDADEELSKNIKSDIDAERLLFDVETSSDQPTNRDDSERSPGFVADPQSSDKDPDEIKSFGHDDKCLFNPEEDERQELGEKNQDMQAENPIMDSFFIISDTDDKRKDEGDAKEQNQAMLDDTHKEPVIHEFAGNIDDSSVPAGDGVTNRQDDDEGENLESGETGETMSMESYFIVQEMEKKEQAADKQRAHMPEGEQDLPPVSTHSGTDSKVDDAKMDPFSIAGYEENTTHRSTGDDSKTQPGIETESDLESEASDQDNMYDAVERKHTSMESERKLDHPENTDVTAGAIIDPGEDERDILHDAVKKLEEPQKDLIQSEGLTRERSNQEELVKHPDNDRENAGMQSDVEKENVGGFPDSDIHRALSEQQGSDASKEDKHKDSFANASKEDNQEDSFTDARKEDKQEDSFADARKEDKQEDPFADASKEDKQGDPVTDARKGDEEYPFADASKEDKQEDPLADASKEDKQEDPFADASKEDKQEDPFVYTNAQRVDEDLESDKNEEFIHSILDEKEAAKHATEDEAESTVNPFAEHELTDVHPKEDVKSIVDSDASPVREVADQSSERNKDVDQELVGIEQELYPDYDEQTSAIHPEAKDEDRDKENFLYQDKSGQNSVINAGLKDLNKGLAGFQEEKDVSRLYPDHDGTGTKQLYTESAGTNPDIDEPTNKAAGEEIGMYHEGHEEHSGKHSEREAGESTKPSDSNNKQGEKFLKEDTGELEDFASGTHPNKPDADGKYPDENKSRERPVKDVSEMYPFSDETRRQPDVSLSESSSDKDEAVKNSNKYDDWKFPDEDVAETVTNKGSGEAGICSNQEVKKTTPVHLSGVQLIKQSSYSDEPNEMDQFSDYIKADEPEEFRNDFSGTFSPNMNQPLVPMEDNRSALHDKDVNQKGYAADTKSDVRQEHGRGFDDNHQPIGDSQIPLNNRSGIEPQEEIGKFTGKDVESGAVPKLDRPYAESQKQRNAPSQGGVDNPSFTDDWDLGPWTKAEREDQRELPERVDDRRSSKPTSHTGEEFINSLFPLDPLGDRSQNIRDSLGDRPQKFRDSLGDGPRDLKQPIGDRDHRPEDFRHPLGDQPQHNTELPVVEPLPGGGNVPVQDRDPHGSPMQPHSPTQEPVTPQKPQAVVVAQPTGITSADPVEDRAGSRQSLTDRDALIPRSENRDGWSTGLFACLPNCGDVCYATSCQQCAVHGLATRMDQSDARTATVAPFCNECYLGDLRTRMRAKYGIKGAEDADCCLACWCAPCVVGQMLREMKERNRP